LAMAKAEKFDVVICDIGLPGMDGYDVAGQLRHQARGKGPVLIALTGYSHTENHKRAAEAGFDHYLVKPVASEVLLKIIAAAPTQQ